MDQKAFDLSPDFGEKVFARYSAALLDLKTDPNLADYIELYSRVTREDLTMLLSSAFWASMSPEESRYHSFRIALGPAHEPSSDYSFACPVTYAPEQISDLAAVLGDGQRSLGVWYSDSGTLQIWGLVYLGYWDIKIHANRPGQLLFSMLAGTTSFEVAIAGAWWGFVDKTQAPLTWAYTGGIRPEALDFTDQNIRLCFRSLDRARSYESIAKLMLRHGHGGALLIVPEDDYAWRNSCSIRYEAVGGFQEVHELVDAWEREVKKETDAGKWFFHDGSTERSRERAAKALGMVGHLTTVDGATILGRDLRVYGFGAKLSPLNPTKRPEKVRVSRPFEGAPSELVTLSDLGGTRHQSAAQFVYDQKGCVAIVCSQDGRLSSLSWDPTHDSVLMVTNLEYAL